MIALAASGTHLFPQVPDGGAAQHVNAVLRDLEAAASENPTLAYILRKFTSHSGRSGPATEANEHEETQCQWIGPRGGWDLGGLQTMFEYIYATIKTDGKVGRALSGWKHVGKGGHCPTINCIDVASREEFAMYAAELMASVQLDAPIKYALVCVLLLHFDAVMAACPSHALIARMVTCRNTGIRRVKYWAAQVRADFQRRNGSSLPEEGDGVMGVPVTEVQEMVVAMKDYEKETVNLREELSEVKQELQHTRRELALQLNLLQQIIHTVNGAGSPPPLSSSSSSAAPPPPPPPRTITGHFFRTLPPTFVPSSSRFPPSLLISLQNVTLSSAFFKWHNEEIFNCRIDTEKERKVRRKLAYAVQMMNRFLPANTIIPRKPNTIDEFHIWAAEIQRLGELSQEKLMNLCCKAYNEEVTAGTRKRKRTLKPNLETMIKRMGQIGKHRPELFTEYLDDDEASNADPELSDLE